MRLFAIMTSSALTAAAIATPAFAQQFVDRGSMTFPGQRPPGTIIMSSAISMSVPVDAGKDIQNQIEDAQKTFYQLAAGQCAIAIQTVADECQITGITNNADINRTIRSEVMIRGSVNMAIKLKSGLSSKP